ncbi:hypothetical protein ABTL75_21345, partial [Acinetobacter baumannii]
IAALVLISFYAVLVWFAPNTQTMMGYDHRGRSVGADIAGGGRSLLVYGAAAALAFGILGIQSHSEFIYFRF